MNILDRMQAKHKIAVDDVTKKREKRDKAIDMLMRAEVGYRLAVKTVGRSQKRLDKAREEDRQAREARKQAKLQSKQELPEIIL